MKKILLSLAVVVGFVGVARAGSPSESPLSYTVCTASMTQIGDGTRAIVIFAVINSSGNALDYSMIVDTTVSSANNVLVQNMASDNRWPAVVFSSVTTSPGLTGTIQGNGLPLPVRGVRSKYTDVFLFKSAAKAAATGEAFTSIVIWKEDTK